MDLLSFLDSNYTLDEPEAVLFNSVNNCSDDHVQEKSSYTDAVKVLLDIAEKTLFYWAEFPLLLPKSILNLAFNKFSITDHFYVPEFNEFEFLAKDQFGNLKRLTTEQLNQIRCDGRFTVPSENFVGEVHVWKVSPVFLKGTHTIKANLKKDLLLAFCEILSGFDFIVYQKMSVRRSVEELWRTILSLLDLFFGWSQVNHGNTDLKLLEEKLHFTSCEFSVKSSKRKQIMEFWDACEYVNSLSPKVYNDNLPACQPPYRFITPSKLFLDLRLHDPVVLQDCLVVISKLIQSVGTGWFQEFKESAISRYQDKNKSVAEIKQLVLQEAMQELSSKLFSAMRESQQLNSVSPGIAEVLIQEAKFNLILAEGKIWFIKNWCSYMDGVTEKIKLNHPILNKVARWRCVYLSEANEEYFKSHRFDLHEYVHSECLTNGLEQHAYVIDRDLAFLKNRQAILRSKLVKNTVFADRQFLYTVSVQIPRFTKVFRERLHHPYTKERIVTKIVDEKQVDESYCTNGIDEDIHTSLLAAIERTVDEITPFQSHSNPTSSEPRYTADKPSDVSDNTKYKTEDCGTGNAKRTLSATDREYTYVHETNCTFKVSTRYFMWRWIAFFVWTYTMLLRTGQYFFFFIPFVSPVSFTMIVKPTPLYLNLKLNEESGYLYYDKSSYSYTLVSYLKKIWFDIREIRKDFDNNVTWGMLDKAAARPFHVFWCYFIRGFLYSSFIVLFWPPICIIISVLSILTGILMIVLVPIYCTVVTLLSIVFWDLYNSKYYYRLAPLICIILDQFLLRTVLQLLLCSLTAICICPFLCVLRALYGISRYTCRWLWETLIFYVVFRRMARVPLREDFLVKHIDGPALTKNYYLLARPEDILLILTAQLEVLELKLWRKQIELIVRKPLNVYNEFLGAFSGLPMSAHAAGQFHDLLVKNQNHYNEEIKTVYKRQFELLAMNMTKEIVNRIKLSDKDLRITLDVGTKLTNYFYQNRIKTRLELLGESTGQWWSQFSVNESDYHGLCSYLLGGVFGEDIFSCITEWDKAFHLKVRDSSTFAVLQNLVSQYQMKSSRNSSMHKALHYTSSTNLHNPHTKSVELDKSDASLLSSSHEINLQDQTTNRNATGVSLKTVVAQFHAVPRQTSELVGRFTVTLDPLSFLRILLPEFPLAVFTPCIAWRLPSALESIVNVRSCCTFGRRGCSSSGWPAPDQHFPGLVQYVAGQPYTYYTDKLKFLLNDPKYSWLTCDYSQSTSNDDEPPVSNRWSKIFHSKAVFKHEHILNILNTIEHMTRVYHAAIVSCIMYSRDREMVQLDYHHPAIRSFINRICIPDNYHEFVHKYNAINNELLPKSTIDSKKFLTESSQSITIVRDHEMENIGVIYKSMDIMKGRISPLSTRSLKLMKCQYSISGKLGKCDSFSPGGLADKNQSVERNKLHYSNQMHIGWNEKEVHKDYSLGTPTPSLYGTEDAATTEDIDDTEDADSFSSMNILSGTMEPQFGSITKDIRMMRLPLAVAERLTISATTAGSEDAHSQQEFELVHHSQWNDDAMPTTTKLDNPYDANSQQQSKIPSSDICLKQDTICQQSNIFTSDESALLISTPIAEANIEDVLHFDPNTTQSRLTPLESSSSNQHLLKGNSASSSALHTTGHSTSKSFSASQPQLYETNEEIERKSTLKTVIELP